VAGAAGELLGYLFAFRDVTHQRAIDRMKTEFVSLASHELRTPLTSIRGYVDLLLEGETGELLPDQRAFLEIVAGNARRLVNLINDLLDLSRIESGRVTLNRTAVDLGYTVYDIAAGLRPALDAKRQTLSIEVAPGLPTVDGDPDRLAQVIANLLSNANKYTPAGGRIRISLVRDGERLLLAVQDDGIGISEEDQAQLFTRFFRARNRATEEVGGTGLGLAISRSLVEMHGGAIAVESAPGAGSTFTVVLPIAPDHPRESPDTMNRREEDTPLTTIERTAPPRGGNDNGGCQPRASEPLGVVALARGLGQ
jgi:signal transduction histidine kinase